MCSDSRLVFWHFCSVLCGMQRASCKSRSVKWSSLVLVQSVFLLFAAFPAWAQDPHCQDVGELITNVGVIPLGGAFGTTLVLRYRGQVGYGGD